MCVRFVEDPFQLGSKGRLKEKHRFGSSDSRCCLKGALLLRALFFPSRWVHFFDQGRWATGGLLRALGEVQEFEEKWSLGRNNMNASRPYHQKIGGLSHCVQCLRPSQVPWLLQVFTGFRPSQVQDFIHCMGRGSVSAVTGQKGSPLLGGRGQQNSDCGRLMYGRRSPGVQPQPCFLSETAS